MKKILLTLLLLPSVVFSQKLEFGINGGIIPYSFYKEIDQPGAYDFDRQSQSTYTFGAKAMINLLAFQVGVGFDYSSIAYTGTLSGTAGTTPFAASVDNDVASPMLAPYLFLNTKIPLPKSYIYFGLHGGHASGEMSSFSYGTVTPLEITNEFKGWFGGLQLGYTFYVTSHIGVNADFAFRAMYMRSQLPKSGVLPGAWLGYDEKNLLLWVPATIGIRYKL